jgi:adenylate cyclase
VVVAAAVPVIFATVLAVYRPASLIGLERATYDSLVRWAGSEPPDGRIVIVDIDERSLSKTGQWPWPRDVIGRLVNRLRERGAATIALDIMFSEPDRYERLAGRATDTPGPTFADVLRSGGALLGYALTFDATAAPDGQCELHPLDLTLTHSADVDPESPFFRAAGVICSLPELARAAGTSGFLNAAPDADGILRRVPLLLEFGGRVYPSLALAAVMAEARRRDAELRIANVNTLALVLGERNVPLDGKSHLLVRYRGKKGMFPYVSAADVLDGPPLPAELFKDKLVFVGTTALGTREVVATPFDTLFAGVEVQATVADNLLRSEFLQRPEHALTLEGLAALVLGLTVVFAIGTRGVAWGILWGVASLVALWAGAARLLTASGWFLSPLFPTIGISAALAAGTVTKYSYERLTAVRSGREKTVSQKLMVETLLSLFETRDFESGSHARRTQQYAELLAFQLRDHPRFRHYLTPERIDLLARLAPLHDIGKVGVPDHVLNKPGALTGDELEAVRQHPARGHDVLLQAERRVGVDNDAILSMAKEIVYTHHERWDGTGYPRGLCGEQIPIPGRLVALVDVYDALVSNRVYRAALPHETAIDLIVEGREKHFDPAIVDAFLHVAPAFRLSPTAHISHV